MGGLGDADGIKADEVKCGEDDGALTIGDRVFHDNNEFAFSIRSGSERYMLRYNRNIVMLFHKTSQIKQWSSNKVNCDNDWLGMVVVFKKWRGGELIFDLLGVLQWFFAFVGRIAHNLMGFVLVVVWENCS